MQSGEERVGQKLDMFGQSVGCCCTQLNVNMNNELYE